MRAGTGKGDFIVHRCAPFTKSSQISLTSFTKQEMRPPHLWAIFFSRLN